MCIYRYTYIYIYIRYIMDIIFNGTWYTGQTQCLICLKAKRVIKIQGTEPLRLHLLGGPHLQSVKSLYKTHQDFNEIREAVLHMDVPQSALLPPDDDQYWNYAFQTFRDASRS